MNKIKNKFIINNFIFFIILFIWIIMLSWAVKPSNEDLHNIGGIYSEKQNLDVIYIGGSSCSVYFAPLQAWENYGIISYDYGCKSIQVESYKTMIKEILKKHSNISLRQYSSEKTLLNR